MIECPACRNSVNLSFSAQPQGKKHWLAAHCPWCNHVLYSGTGYDAEAERFIPSPWQGDQQ